MSSMSRFYHSLLSRLFTRMPGRAHGQRGASALEYVVLAAAIIVIVGVLATVFGGDSNPLSEAFTDLFSDAASAGGG